MEIKQEKINDQNKLKYINEEYKILKSELDKNINTNNELDKLFKSRRYKLKSLGYKDDKRLCEKNLILVKSLLSFQEIFIF